MDVYAAGLMLAAILTGRNPFFNFSKSKKKNLCMMSAVYGADKLGELATLCYKKLDETQFHFQSNDDLFQNMKEWNPKSDKKMSTFITWNSKRLGILKVHGKTEQQDNKRMFDFLDNLTTLHFWCRPTSGAMLNHPYLNLPSSTK